MKPAWKGIAVAVACLVGACDDGGGESDDDARAAPADSGRADSGRADSGRADSGAADARPGDAAPPCLHGERNCEGDTLLFCDHGTWVEERDCAVSGERCLPVLGGLPSCQMPPVELEPVTRGRAVALAAYARRLRVATPDDPTPGAVAWSMVNVSCQDRAMALEFALATGLAPAAPDPPLLDTRTVTRADLEALLGQGVGTVGAINLTGPLVTAHRFVLPDGTEVLERTPFFYWAYHHGVVLNVDGELAVVDLSTGDEPLPIEDWVRGFVPPSVECHRMGQAEYQTVWSYWSRAFGNLIPAERPERLCGYTLSSLFTLDLDDQPQLEFVLDAAGTMRGLFLGLRNELEQLGVVVPDEQLPDVLSRYTALPEDTVCEVFDFSYCPYR